MSAETFYQEPTDMTRAELVALHQGLHKIEQILGLSHLGGRDNSSAITAVHEVQEVIEELTRNAA